MSLGKEDEKNSAELDRKTCCNAMLLPGNLEVLSQTPRGPVVPLVCGFIRRDNLQAWRELIRNLCKRKSRI